MRETTLPDTTARVPHAATQQSQLSNPTTPTDEGPKASVRNWLGLAVLMLVVLVVSIDNTVLSFALPEISRELHPSGTALLWIIDIYSLVLAGLLVTMGTLGDRIGRRKLLLIGAIGFGAVSVYAAFSTSAEHLIAARALLGLFGATLMPSTLALLRNLFLNDTERRLAIAIWAAGFSAGAALGPIVGGWMLEHYWWGSVFLINVPVIAVLLATGLFLLPESRDPNPGRLDWTSVFLSIAAMFTLVYGIKTLAAGGQAPAGVAFFVGGLVLGYLFVRRQLRAENPMLDMHLFTNRVFSASIAANLMSVLAMAGMVYYLSQYLQLVLGYSPLNAGFYLLPGLFATIASGLFAVRLANRFPLRVLIPVGLGLSMLGFATAAQLGAHSSVWLLVGAFFMVGLGVGLAETLTNDAILASVPPHKAGAASGISETAYEVGALLGTAILGSVLTAAYRNGLTVPEGVSGADSAAAHETLGGALDVAAGIGGSVGDQLTEAAKVAFSHGADLTSMAGAVILLGAVLITAISLRKSHA
ncbi:MFS transporter [Timonella senegalensis]|uniref:MFS transporter n=1 Tax=Timonella senegalensis TaxID=1465825 RepID=UPI0028A9A8B9|nr:MFS transporter [Timonella senegalensis]